MSETKPRVLIVDDEPSSIEILCEILGAVCVLHIAKTGEEAYQLHGKNLFDLILMDVELPDASGFDICRKLKAEVSRDIPVIFISGHDDLIFEIQAFEAGAVDYLVKPISPIRVLMRMNVHLETKLPLPSR